MSNLLQNIKKKKKKDKTLHVTCSNDLIRIWASSLKNSKEKIMKGHLPDDYINIDTFRFYAFLIKLHLVLLSHTRQ
jgi:hypothetical protein